MRKLNNRVFVKEGAIVKVKEDVPDLELTPKDVLEQMDYLVAAVDKAEQDIENAKRVIQQSEDAKKYNENSLKQLKQFEDWALEAQESKCKNIINNKFDEFRLKIDAEYKFDPALTDEHNNLNKYMMLQNYIARSKDVADNIAPRIYKRLCFTESVIKNPWK